MLRTNLFAQAASRLPPIVCHRGHASCRDLQERDSLDTRSSTSDGSPASLPASPRSPGHPTPSPGQTGSLRSEARFVRGRLQVATQMAQAAYEKFCAARPTDTLQAFYLDACAQQEEGTAALQRLFAESLRQQDGELALRCLQDLLEVGWLSTDDEVEARRLHGCLNWLLHGDDVPAAQTFTQQSPHCSDRAELLRKTADLLQQAGWESLEKRALTALAGQEMAVSPCCAACQSPCSCGAAVPESELSNLN